eukprot:s2889_g1.t1
MAELLIQAFPLRLPPGAADDIRSSSSMALSADGRHPAFLHANSASMSPSSFRLHHVGLASGGSSPTDAPLELIPKDYNGPTLQASSPSRRGPLQPLRQNSSAAMSTPLNPRIGGGEASLTLPDDAMVPRRLVTDPGSQSVPQCVGSDWLYDLRRYGLDWMDGWTDGWMDGWTETSAWMD